MMLSARRLLAVGLILAAAWAAARPGRSDEAFTPVKSSVRYRKIGVYDKARLAAIVEKELDAFLTGSTMKPGAPTTRCQGMSVPAGRPARSLPTKRARRGRPADAATCP